MHKVSFQPVAPYYDQLAKLVFGTFIQQAQIAYLHHVPENSHLLIVGGGTGWIVEKLIKGGRCSQITFLETAPAMIAKARKRYKKLAAETDVKVHFVQGSVDTLQPKRDFNAVITFFLLDLYSTTEVHMLVKAILQRLEFGGVWLFADFDPVKRKRPLFWQNLLLWLMYCFFRLTTNLKNQALPDYKTVFTAAGLVQKESCYFYHSMIRSSVYCKV